MFELIGSLHPSLMCHITHLFQFLVSEQMCHTSHFWHVSHFGGSQLLIAFKDNAKDDCFPSK